MVIIINGDIEDKVYKNMNKLIPGIDYSWNELVYRTLEDLGVDTLVEDEKFNRCKSKIESGFNEYDILLDDCKDIINDVWSGNIDNCDNVYIKCDDNNIINNIKIYCNQIKEPCYYIYCKNDINDGFEGIDNIDFVLHDMTDNDSILSSSELFFKEIISNES